jgi:hypothetical protein
MPSNQPQPLSNRFFRAKLVSLGIGLNGIESRAYVIPVFSEAALERWMYNLHNAGRTYFGGKPGRILRVKTLCQMQIGNAARVRRTVQP